jgi:23S rRNA (uracil1939-C5)-methyltransferase
LPLTIEKLIYGGDGLARLPAETGADSPVRSPESKGKAVFIPFTLEGETVESTLVEQKPGFVRAQLDQVVTASPNRVPPRCPYFQRCGGCRYQHTTYDHQLAIKSGILKETLRRQAKLELAQEIILHAAEPWHYRNRSRFQVRTTPGICAGYFQFGSHNVLAVEDCPISSPLINRALTAIWELGRAGQIPSEVREIEFFANADDSRLLSELWFDPVSPVEKRVRLGEKLTGLLRDHLPFLTSSYVFAQPALRSSRPAAEPIPDWALGGGEFRYSVAGNELRVSGGSFFQVNRFLIGRLVEVATARAAGDLALDLYAGVGLFTTALAKSFRHILAVESSQSSFGDLKYNSPDNARAIHATVENYLGGKKRQGKPEFILVDPPRAGLGDAIAREIARMNAQHLTYVSCDPTTLARDLALLQAAGYRIEQVHLIDLFPQTFHLETVVHLIR